MKTDSTLIQTRAVRSLALVVLGLSLAPVTAADSTFSDANWISTGGVPGATGRVRAAVVDGTGNLYIGGDFTLAGDVIANGIAKWNGINWSALGSGVMSDILALAVSGSDLYVGGRFTRAGGIAVTNIAKWDGSSWSPLGAGIGDRDPNNWYSVSELIVSGTDLLSVILSCKPF
jgi:hypothetical protein